MKNSIFTKIFNQKIFRYMVFYSLNRSGNFIKCIGLILLVSFITVAKNFGQILYPVHYEGDSIFNLGENALNQEKYIDAASHFSTILPTDPLYKNAKYKRLLTWVYLDKIDEVLSEFDSLYKSGGIEKDYEMLILYGIILKSKEEFEKGIEVFSKAEELVPNSSILHYNFGTLYHSKKDFQKCVDHLKIAVLNNPNHISSHFLLGEVLLENGKVSEGSLALLSGLVNTNTGKSASLAIQKLNAKMSNYDVESTLRTSSSGDDFSELDLILKNQLALNPKYKLKASIDDIVTRHIQAILEYAETHKMRDGFFENLYIPWMKEIAKRKEIEAFTYYILQDYRKVLGKKLTSKDKMVETFSRDYLLRSFWDLYGKRKLLHFGKEEEVVIYLEDGWPSLIGKVVDDKFEGMFLAINKNGQRRAELNFVAGQKTGIQKYFNEENILYYEAMFNNDKKTGEAKTYYTNGFLKEIETYKDGKLNGPYSTYYPNGGLDCKGENVNEMDTGPLECSHPDGTIRLVGHFKEGKYDGNQKIFNMVGDLVYDFNYLNGEKHGKCIEYYDGKVKKSEGEYANGKVVGSIFYYFGDGNISAEIKYSNFIIKEYLVYNDLGKLSEQRAYDEKGTLTNIVYYDISGEKHYEEKYVGGKLRGGLQYIEGQNTPQEIKLKGETFIIKSFQGQTLVRGKFIKGKMSGDWEYFFKNGNLSSTQKYENDVATGDKTYYNFTGQMASKTTYRNGVPDGIVQLYDNENLYHLYYNLNEQQSGPYINFGPTGKVTYEGFVINGIKNFETRTYYNDGKLYNTTQYINDEIIKQKFWNPDGNSDGEQIFTGLNGEVTFWQNNKLVNIKGNFTNGKRNGLFIYKDVSGNLLSEVWYKNGELHGKKINYYPNQNIQSELNYYNGQLHGKVIQYDFFGNVRLEYENLFNVEHGENIRYYGTGKKMYTFHVVNDEKQGDMKVYNMEGQIIGVVGYQSGYIVYYKSIDKSGDLGPQININLNEEVNIMSFYPNGKKAFHMGVKNGYKEGPMEIFANDGKLLYSAFFKNDKIDKERKEYYPDGKLFKRENFNSGNYEGLTEIFYKDGKLAASLTYVNDEYHGEFKFYNKEKLQKILYYDSDILYGEISY